MGTAEEKRQWFRKPTTPDLTAYHLSSNFGKFTIPEKDEGVDEIKYLWSKEERCKDYLKCWIRDRKATARIEDLQPGEWFHTKWKNWQETLQSWREKQNSHKRAKAEREMDKQTRAAIKESRKRAKEAAARKKIEDGKRRQ